MKFDPVTLISVRKGSHPLGRRADVALAEGRAADEAGPGVP